MDKAQEVIFKALKQSGWLQAGENNPYLAKNDFLFVYHKGDCNNNPVRRFEYGSELKTNVRPVLLNPNRCSWHLERYGWLIDKGQVASAIAELYDNSVEDFPNAAEILDELIKRVNDFADKSDIAIKAFKQHLVSVDSKERKRTVVESSDKIDKGSYFMTVNMALSCGLQHGKVYYIEDYNPNGFFISTMNNNLNGVKKNGNLLIPVEEFLKLVKSKFIYAVEIQEDLVTNTELVWKNLEESQSVDFPAELQQFHVPKLKQHIIASAFNKSLNITPFLNNKFAKESLKVLFDYGERGIDISKFYRASFDKAALEEVLSLMEQGYCVDSLLDKDYSADYIKAIFDESYADLHTKEDGLKSLGFNQEQIKVILGLYFDGINTAFIENKEYSAKIMQLLFYAAKNPMLKPIADLFLSKAFESEKLYIPADFLTGKEKACVRNIFSVNNPLSIRGQSWEDFIEGMLESLRFVYFVPGKGFIFRTNNLGVGFDQNSFYVTEVTDIPKWRATLINDTFFVNKALENQLYY